MAVEIMEAQCPSKDALLVGKAAMPFCKRLTKILVFVKGCTMIVLFVHCNWVGGAT